MKQSIFNSCDKDITKYFQLSRTIPCPNCGATAHKLGVGKGPHSASLRCGECDRFIKWIGKSELAKIQNQGGQK